MKHSLMLLGLLVAVAGCGKDYPPEDPRCQTFQLCQEGLIYSGFTTTCSDLPVPGKEGCQSCRIPNEYDAEIPVEHPCYPNVIKLREQRGG